MTVINQIDGDTFFNKLQEVLDYEEVEKIRDIFKESILYPEYKELFFVEKHNVYKYTFIGYDFQKEPIYYSKEGSSRCKGFSKIARDLIDREGQFIFSTEEKAYESMLNAFEREMAYIYKEMVKKKGQKEIINKEDNL